MSLADFIQAERGRSARLAESLGVHPTLISQWAAGRPVPVVHCAAIELATGGAVSRKILRPDDWQRIWPELAPPPALDAQPEHNAGQQTEQAPA